MPYTGDAKNAMLAEMVAKVKDLGCYEDTTLAQTWTSTGAILKSNTAHGLTTGMLIYFSALAGPTAGALFASLTGTTATERLFFVKEVSTTEIELSETASFAQATWTTNVSSATVHKAAEVSDTRAAVTMKAAAQSLTESEAAATVVIAGACTVNWVSSHSALTAGTLYALAKVTAEVFSAAGSFEVKKSTLDLLGAQ